MEYLLKASDIQRLKDLGFYSDGMTPMEGEPATMDEMISLGIDTRLPEEQPEIDPNTILPPITDEVNVPARVNPQQAISTGGMNPQMQQLLELIKQQQEAAMKPPSQSYTKDQKRMLAFAGIADAGRALQGKEGTAVSSLIGNFTEMADQRRKAEAAQAQRSLISSMIGGTGGMSGMGGMSNLTDPDQIRDQIAKLTNMLAINPNLAPFINLSVDNLYKQLEKVEGDIETVQTTKTQIDLVDSLLDADLSQVSGVKNFVNSIFEPFGLAKKYQNIESMLKQLEGLNFVEAYQALKGGGPITDIEGKAATAAKSRVRNSIGGSEADIRAALEETKRFFNEALRKNPAYADKESEKERLLKKWSGTGNEG